MLDALTPTNFTKAAQNWLRTPFAPNMRIKGLGCDCAGLIEGILCEFGVPIKSRTDQNLEDGLGEVFCAASLNEITHGDIILFKNLGASDQFHCAIMTMEEKIIHAHWGRGVVLNTYGNWFKARAIKTFKIKGQI